MGAELLSLLIPVTAGREQEVRRAIEAFPVGAESPFASVPGTHVARLVVIDAFGSTALIPRRLHPSVLLLSALVDGDVRRWLLAMCQALGASGDEIWEHCGGWPGNGPATTARWLAGFRIRMHKSIVGNPEASVEAVQQALRRRDNLLQLAIHEGRLGPRELRRQYRTTVQGGAGS